MQLESLWTFPRIIEPGAFATACLTPFNFAATSRFLAVRRMKFPLCMFASPPITLFLHFASAWHLLWSSCSSVFVNFLCLGLDSTTKCDRCRFTQALRLRQEKMSPLAIPRDWLAYHIIPFDFDRRSRQ